MLIFSGGEDYEPTNQLLTFSPTNQNTALCVLVLITNDSNAEGPETFFGRLTTSEVRVTLTPDQTTITILDDDGKLHTVEPVLIAGCMENEFIFQGLGIWFNPCTACILLVTFVQLSESVLSMIPTRPQRRVGLLHLLYKSWVSWGQSFWSTWPLRTSEKQLVSETTPLDTFSSPAPFTPLPPSLPLQLVLTMSLWTLS